MSSQFTNNKNSVQTHVSLEDKSHLHLTLQAPLPSQLKVRKYAGLINIALYTYHFKPGHTVTLVEILR